jgi:DNA-binding transcriptional MerR regulator
MPQLQLFSSGHEQEESLKKKEHKENMPRENRPGKKTGDDNSGTVQQLLSNISQPREDNSLAEKLTLQPGEPRNAVVFNDGKISVRIKSKEVIPAPEAAIITEKEIAGQPEEKIKPVKTSPGRGRKSLKEINAEADLIEVPEDEVLFQKQYYAISTVAEWFKVNTSLLRFWENEFDILKPRKNRKGDRMFRPEDVKNLQLIYHLLRHRKYTIDGAKEYLKSNKSGADVQLQLTQTLQKFKLFLLELKANL